MGKQGLVRVNICFDTQYYTEPVPDCKSIKFIYYIEWLPQTKAEGQLCTRDKKASYKPILYCLFREGGNLLKAID